VSAHLCEYLILHLHPHPKLHLGSPGFYTHYWPKFLSVLKHRFFTAQIAQRAWPQPWAGAAVVSATGTLCSVGRMGDAGVATYQGQF